MAQRGRPKKTTIPKSAEPQPTRTDQASSPDVNSLVNDDEVIAKAKQMEADALKDLPPVGGGPTPTGTVQQIDQFEEKAKRSAVLALTLISETRKKVGMTTQIPPMVETSFVESFVELCKKYQLNADLGPEIVFGSCVVYFAWEGYEIYQDRKRAAQAKTGGKKPGVTESSFSSNGKPGTPPDESSRDS